MTSFEERIAQAIGDPGSIVGNRIHTSFGDDRDETITRWATRAVLAVSEDRRVQLRDAQNDLLNVRGLLSPQGWPDVTPVPIVPNVAPAVEWLIAEVKRLNAVIAERDRVGTPEWEYEQEQCAAEQLAEELAEERAS